MTFFDLLFDPYISYGAVGGAGYSTTVARTRSNKEKRNRNWERSACMFDVVHALKYQEELDELIKFFHVCNGKAHSFRFLDWTDYTITNENIGSFDGNIGTELQLKKTYEIVTGDNQTRNIYKPVNTSNSNHTLDLETPVYNDMTVTIGGSPAIEDTDYEVDYSTGLISDLIGVSGAVRVTCSFHCHCRFDTDIMKISLDSYNLSSWGEIPIVELKEP